MAHSTESRPNAQRESTVPSGSPLSLPPLLLPGLLSGPPSRLLSGRVVVLLLPAPSLLSILMLLPPAGGACARVCICAHACTAPLLLSTAAVTHAPTPTWSAARTNASM